MRNKPSGVWAETVWAIHSKLANWVIKYAPVFERLISTPQKIKTESVSR
jgi:hypothetical protein